ncbi:integrase [Aurantiacibacter xanthus]|uniref:Integrase n=1 Tax=Aurantiacibacter xanthus TaxID=1784712 RepID=A0A3A1NYL8_9SPHN|nr:site-specific integrase [Aurantiacibacter xanthus]RIV80480.1 integrase [Aurantiacibacter xanthus]
MDLSKVGERQKLKARREPYWQRLSPGRFLGYRPSQREGLGTWVARIYDDDARKYHLKALGDFVALLARDRFAAAKGEVEKLAEIIATGGEIHREVETVADACRAYEAKGNDKATLQRLVFSDPIGDVKLDKLRRHHLREWRSRLTGKPSTINRAMVPLRAALGAVKEAGRPGTDAAWQEALKPAPKKEVKPEEHKRTYLTKEKRKALAELTPLVKALTILPIRPGALAALRVRDFDKRSGALTIPTDKAGAGRRIPLSGPQRHFIAAQCKGKTPAAWMFVQPDGKRWERHDWAVLLRQHGVSAYDVRHAVLTDLVDHGVPPNTVAKLAGTSVLMLQEHYYQLTDQAATDALARLAL